MRQSTASAGAVIHEVIGDLARKAGLVRPMLGSAAVVIQGGRHLPCEALCPELGTPYTPLEATFAPGATVLFGSNMGGKTVVRPGAVPGRPRHVARRDAAARA